MLAAIRAAGPLPYRLEILKPPKPQTSLQQSEQQALYETAVFPMISSLFAGINVTVLAYGQTGSGKTFTMGTNASTLGGDNAGVIPRIIEEIFKRIDAREDKGRVLASFLEIHNDDIIDLLSGSSTPCNLREDTSGVVVAGLKEVAISGATEMLDLLNKGSNQRATASTNMNR
jgi:hypothetical protein